ncbi:ShlB/FhaC/HecB family hemolysin secretion/activation protein [Hydrogenophaga sp. 2FB]|uniref:ShlB/FhaC/HecB family hemolysin secretion/activation protein n=1 Tax=Hydrogenophaga sp. 2FB TaxID=2502187 RepID=UPI0014851FC7|nr:ShlB/FhaC/HecB family hemolysin secretion/activation protein [Hydrogenophaga sp. 2FB]
MTRTTPLARCCALAILLASSTVHAQDAAGEIGAIQRLEREQLERLRQEQRLRQRPVTPGIVLPPTPAPSAASQERNIAVKRFEVDRSEILSEAEIRATLAPYENRTVSLEDLFGAVAALNQLYDQKQMPTARAVLPPQDVRDGVVRIRLVEARVGEVKVESANQVSSAFVRDRVRVQEGRLLSVPELESDLVRFNRLHQAQLRANVRAGQAPGTTDVALESVEPKPYRFSVFTDNAGRTTVGHLRLGVLAQWNGLASRDDSLSLSAVRAKGSESQYIGYSTPLTRDDLRLEASYSEDDIKVIRGPFVPLDIGGESSSLTVGLSQPFVVDARRLWRAYARFADRHSKSTFGGFTQQDTHLTVLTLGTSGDYQGDGSVWTLDLNLNLGEKSLGSDRNFVALRANTAWLASLTPKTQLLLRFGLQYSPTDLLPSSEQYQLGGSVSVRGYSEGLLTGNSGYLASAELRQQLLQLGTGGFTPALTGFAFLDHGGAFPYRPSPLKDVVKNDFLSSAGIGLQADWSQRVQARMTLGWPLRDNPGEVNLRRPRLHASLTYSWP